MVVYLCHCDACTLVLPLEQHRQDVADFGCILVPGANISADAYRYNCINSYEKKRLNKFIIMAYYLDPWLQHFKSCSLAASGLVWPMIGAVTTISTLMNRSTNVMTRLSTKYVSSTYQVLYFPAFFVLCRYSTLSTDTVYVSAHTLGGPLLQSYVEASQLNLWDN